MTEEFDDDTQDIPAAAPKSHLVNPKLIVVLVVLVPSTLDLLCHFPILILFRCRSFSVHFAFGLKKSMIRAFHLSVLCCWLQSDPSSSLPAETQGNDIARQEVQARQEGARENTDDRFHVGRLVCVSHDLQELIRRKHQFGPAAALLEIICSELSVLWGTHVCANVANTCCPCPKFP
jgi:hypothetical protein